MYLVRVEGIEPSSQVWKTCILTVVLHPRVSRALYNFSSIIKSMMKLGINFDAERDDVFHSHGYAKIAYGPNLGSASPKPGGGRAGEGDIGAVGTYRYAGVPNRRSDDPTTKEAPAAEPANSRRTLHVKERAGKDKAAFSHRDPSEAPASRTFSEPPGRSYNPYG
jgi:hypothetical protein